VVDEQDGNDNDDDNDGVSTIKKQSEMLFVRGRFPHDCPSQEMEKTQNGGMLDRKRLTFRNIPNR
jgi:hypothetical protein